MIDNMTACVVVVASTTTTIKQKVHIGVTYPVRGHDKLRRRIIVRLERRGIFQQYICGRIGSGQAAQVFHVGGGKITRQTGQRSSLEPIFHEDLAHFVQGRVAHRKVGDCCCLCRLMVII